MSIGKHRLTARLGRLWEVRVVSPVNETPIDERKKHGRAIIGPVSMYL
jgi:hypothetical protein